MFCESCQDLQQYVDLHMVGLKDNIADKLISIISYYLTNMKMMAVYSVKNCPHMSAQGHHY